MQIAIASGKGGTGKTFVATNLALVATEEGSVQLLDCDVEEPNCHIFLKPHIVSTEDVCVPVPEVDEERCTGCRECAEFCQFNALACINQKVLTFPELCHSCGGCWLVCPEGAISKGSRKVGVLERGFAKNLAFTHGKLRVGEAMAPPLIRTVRASVLDSTRVIIDAPPGTSCPVISAIRGVDFVCLVAEPTPFGLNDLILAIEMTSRLGLPTGVIINQCDVGDDRLHRYCQRQRIPVLAEIPHDRRVAEAYSRGLPAVDSVDGYREVFARLFRVLENQSTKQVGTERKRNTDEQGPYSWSSRSTNEGARSHKR